MRANITSVSTDQRIEALEAAVGFDLPENYRDFLQTFEEDPSRPVQVVSTNPDYWDVRSIFEIGNHADHLQVDRCYALVGDVLPAGMVPVAADSGGNLYLVDCRASPAPGAVYWWDHEQELGEDRVSRAANGFLEFLAALVPDAEL